MNICFVVHHPRDWPYDTPGATVVNARTYLDDSGLLDAPDAGLRPSDGVPRGERTALQVVNLCKSYRYQSRGYYVSLLAEARGQRPMPDVRTIEDLNQSRLLRLLTERLDDTIRRSLAGVDACALELDVCFGADATRAHETLARELFDCLRLPLLRARFERDAVDAGRPDERADAPGEAGASRPAASESAPGRRRGWRLSDVRALGPTEIRPEHRAFMAEAAAAWVRASGPAPAVPRDTPPRQPAIAILHDASSADAPSNAAALAKFREAAQTLGMRCEMLSRRDIERLAQFDALFVRDTTNVNHYTYRFARRAAALGLVTIDDPDSILKCTNKVYLHELLGRNRIPTPRTLMVHKGNVERVVPTLGLPCILKRPDSAFSLGVKKATTPEELSRTVAEFLQKSELIVAQEFLPTAFDWRVGVLDGRALFVCKYFMAPGHWQVIKREPGAADGRVEGSTVACSIGEAPAHVVDVAVRAAALIGDGLYGVDIKQVEDRCYVIEINDNPNVDAGNEDGVLGDALYREVMGVFLRRIRARRDGAAA